MASFAVSGTTYSFDERGDDGKVFPVFGTQAEAEAEHHPGGNVVSIDYTGNNLEVLNLNIKCTAAQLSSLKLKVGTIGTLSWSGGSRSSFLYAVQSPGRLLDNDLFLATLIFWGR